MIIAAKSRFRHGRGRIAASFNLLPLLKPVLQISMVNCSFSGPKVFIGACPYAASQAASETDTALGAVALKIAAQSDKAILAVIEAADQNARALLPPGQGKSVDLSA
jgi:hypothetical protein